jgi:type IV pilus assembly protein PilC
MMALYSYKAINDLGQLCRGRLEADSEPDVELQLRRTGLELLSARAVPAFAFAAGNRIGPADLTTLFFNLEQLLRAGVPLLESLSDLRDSMDNRRLGELLNGMIVAIEGGKSLSQAMAGHAQVFDTVVVSLVRAGEGSGRLAEIFKQLADSIKWHDEMTRQGKSMMIYPAFVGVTVLGVTVFLMIYLVPQLTAFISNMGQTLPWQTRLLLATSSMFVHYWPFMLALPVALLALLRLALARQGRMRHRLDRLRLHLPFSGPILRKTIMARFANTFAMLYGSGISVLDCIANLRDLVDNRVIAASLDQVIGDIEAGKNLTQSFLDAGVFPPLVVRMIRVGEATGRLDEALYNVGYFYDRDVKDAIRKTQILIEPAMTVILGLLLGWVMLSVLSPVYEIISKVNI